MEQKQQSSHKTKYRRTTLAEDLKNPKKQWAAPKNCFALVTLISDEHYKRLRRWILLLVRFTMFDTSKAFCGFTVAELPKTLSLLMLT